MRDNTEAGELTDLDLEMVKRNLDRLLKDPTIGPKLKEIAIEATDHLIKAVELFPDLEEIPVSEEIYIQYDKADTWAAIIDRDESHYDRGGAVLLGYDNLQNLEKALRQLRGKVKADETAQPEFLRQFGLYHDALERLSNNQIIMVALSLMLQEIDQNPFINALVIQLQARGGYSPINVTGEEEGED
jgi:hypothetical protein